MKKNKITLAYNSVIENDKVIIKPKDSNLVNSKEYVFDFVRNGYGDDSLIYRKLKEDNIEVVKDPEFSMTILWPSNDNVKRIFEEYRRHKSSDSFRKWSEFKATGLKDLGKDVEINDNDQYMVIFATLKVKAIDKYNPKIPLKQLINDENKQIDKEVKQRFPESSWFYYDTKLQAINDGGELNLFISDVNYYAVNSENIPRYNFVRPAIYIPPLTKEVVANMKFEPQTKYYNNVYLVKLDKTNSKIKKVNIYNNTIINVFKDPYKDNFSIINWLFGKSGSRSDGDYDKVFEIVDSFIESPKLNLLYKSIK
ncbi:hypothetical protein GE118_03270 [Mycoplasma sp. NEAQ87857]|uniref:hypothetical protein n=1 Tax=Mycoplasma sp. NEAQ87857 TaxID=2683967 RepID=UPI001316CEDC|nr:hypothetical protein [Mycoplasma sp. NEAQ87857]QGZ97810.1 hypothetical protein GE118_03270 [Mycoplasma sp. NEAQ87857]